MIYTYVIHVLQYIIIIIIFVIIIVILIFFTIILIVRNWWSMIWIINMVSYEILIAIWMSVFLLWTIPSLTFISILTNLNTTIQLNRYLKMWIVCVRIRNKGKILWLRSNCQWFHPNLYFLIDGNPNSEKIRAWNLFTSSATQYIWTTEPRFSYHRSRIQCIRNPTEESSRSFQLYLSFC